MGNGETKTAPKYDPTGEIGQQMNIVTHEDGEKEGKLKIVKKQRETQIKPQRDTQPDS